jgi:FkbM family methyltransferase
MSTLKELLRRIPFLHAGLKKARLAVVQGRIRLLGLGYTERPIKGGPIKGLSFLAAKRVFYSKWFWNGTFEQETCELLRDKMTPDGIAYDIGANLGYHTLVMAVAAPRGHVYAFEPIPQVCRILEKNVETNRLPQVTIVGKAVAAEAGSLDLGWDTSLDQAALQFVEGEHHPRLERIRCEGITLDDFIAEGNRPPSLLKIDVEGAEVDVLRGGRGALLTHGPDVVCEIHGPEAARGVYDILREWGYDLFLVRRGLVPIRSAEDMPNKMDEGHVWARRTSRRPK